MTVNFTHYRWAVSCHVAGRGWLIQAARQSRVGTDYGRVYATVQGSKAKARSELARVNASVPPPVPADFQREGAAEPKGREP